MPVSTLTGVGELGCAAPMELPPGPGFVPTSTDIGMVWLPASSGALVIDLTLTAGALTVMVNGVAATVQLAGLPVEDAFGVGLGYLLEK